METRINSRERIFYMHTSTDEVVCNMEDVKECFDLLKEKRQETPIIKQIFNRKLERVSRKFVEDMVFVNTGEIIKLK